MSTPEEVEILPNLYRKNEEDEFVPCDDLVQFVIAQAKREAIKEMISYHLPCPYPSGSLQNNASIAAWHRGVEDRQKLLEEALSKLEGK